MLGLRVGYILGVFEALRYYYHYQQHAGGNDDDGLLGEKEGERGDTRGGVKIWREAESALKMDRIFGENFFDSDGVWKFDIGAGRQGQGLGEEHQEKRRDLVGDGVSAGKQKQGEEKAEEQKGRDFITFLDVADSHPLIKEWMQKAKDELSRCGFEDRGGTTEVESQ